jgi:putative transposase
VRARLVRRARDWPWSSVRAHLKGRDDGLVTVAPLLDRIDGRFADLIATGPTPEELAALRAAETIGRPLGAPRFLDRLEAKLGRTLRPGKRGRPAGGGAGAKLGK